MEMVCLLLKKRLLLTLHSSVYLDVVIDGSLLPANTASLFNVSSPFGSTFNRITYTNYNSSQNFAIWSNPIGPVSVYEYVYFPLSFKWIYRSVSIDVWRQSSSTFSGFTGTARVASLTGSNIDIYRYVPRLLCIAGNKSKCLIIRSFYKSIDLLSPILQRRFRYCNAIWLALGWR